MFMYTPGMHDNSSAWSRLYNIDALRRPHDLVEIHDVRMAQLAQQGDLHAERIEEFVILQLLCIKHLSEKMNSNTNAL